jgi:hypothetical protein
VITAIVLSLHALGLVPRVEGAAAPALPWFDKLTTGRRVVAPSCEPGRRRVVAGD